jgi:adenylate cyclase
LPAFAQGALAAAPYPLPLLGSRVTAFWAFKTGAAGEATLPAAALLAALLADPVQREALALLAERAGLKAAAAVVRTDGHPFESWVAGLRSALLQAPDDARRHLQPHQEGPELPAAALRLLTGPDSHLLAPYGPAGWLPRLSYHRVVSGEPEALAALRNSIVFVGVSDLSERVQTDAFPTVFTRQDGIDPAGVEVAATACLNLLHGHSLQPAPPLPALALTGLTAGSTAAAAVLLALLLSSALALGLGGALAAAGLAALSGWQIVLPLGSLLAVAIPLGLAVGLLARYGILRRQLDRAFSLLTRGRVARAPVLVGLEQAVRHERRWGVCLSTDLAGYVRLTDSMRARERALASLVADYRGLIIEVVERHQGIVLSWAGDASMCIWLADKPSLEVRARAVAAALELAAELDRFAARLNLPAHHTRIGLAEGELVLGNLAAGEHFSFGAVGEPLNVAARLEQLNKQLGTRVLATRSVVKGLSNVNVRVIGSVQLRGRSHADEVVMLDHL